MRRMTGAILMLMRPDRMIMSAWRGDARNASKPKRPMSIRDLQLAAEHVARPHLADAERVGDLLAPDYLHSRAPLRQTYTRATSSSAMKTTVSTSANDPNARNWI